MPTKSNNIGGRGGARPGSGRYKLEDYGTPNHSTEAEQLAVESWNRRDG